MKKKEQFVLLCCLLLSVVGLVGCDLLLESAFEIPVTPWPSAELQAPIDLSQFPPFDLPKDDHIGIIVASEWVEPNALVTIETVDYETWNSVSEEVIVEHHFLADDGLRFSPNDYLWGNELESDSYHKTPFTSLSVFDGTGKRIKKVHYDCDLVDLLFYGGKAYYTCLTEPRIFVVDEETLTAVTAIDVGEEMFTINKLGVNGGRLIATASKRDDKNSYLVQIDLESDQVLSISEPMERFNVDRFDQSAMYQDRLLYFNDRSFYGEPEYEDVMIDNKYALVDFSQDLSVIVYLPGPREGNRNALTGDSVFSVYRDKSERYPDGWVQENRDENGDVHSTEVRERAFFLMESNLTTSETERWELSIDEPCFNTFFTYDQDTYLLASLPPELVSSTTMLLPDSFAEDDPRRHSLCPREWVHGIFRLDRQTGLFEQVWEMEHSGWRVSFLESRN